MDVNVHVQPAAATVRPSVTGENTASTKTATLMTLRSGPWSGETRGVVTGQPGVLVNYQPALSLTGPDDIHHQHQR